MGNELEKKLDEAIWIAHTLFNRDKASGSIANLSFIHNDLIYITGTGTCFGMLTKKDFAVVNLEGESINEIQPSKELPLHLSIYRAKESAKSVLHIHSTYSVLWSFVPDLNKLDCIPSYTPYLKMKLGTVGLVPYNYPGSKELLSGLNEVIKQCDGWLLAQHGPIVPGGSLLEAFYAIEELEESAKIAWEIYNSDQSISANANRRII
ncbi:class II aldolase/adducin family protein [Sporosarcina sp. P33]|uniref:class II aldolase/adducin family protein n=1 Tax=Sporosarcina sp. P33 TaxID=1930764 RepID=UPI0018C8CE52|nr:class II aldolase/adducin family protein [Sporosarcina sp. P33]